MESVRAHKGSRGAKVQKDVFGESHDLWSALARNPRMRSSSSYDEKRAAVVR